MSLERRLDAWVEAGLIDPATAIAIRNHEGAHERPVARYAIAGLGLFAVLLGIILLISANWDQIPHGVKIGAHLALLLAAGAAHWVARARRPGVAEGALFLFAGLILAGIALQSQVYQLTGPAWHAFLLWLALAAPALLAGGRTRLTGIALAVMALLGPAVMAVDTVDQGGPWRLAQGAAMAVPALLFLLATALPGDRPGFRIALRDAGLVTLLGGASIAHFAWASHITPVQALDNAVRLGPAALACLAALLVARIRPELLPRPLHLPLFLGAPLAFGLALAIPHPDGTASRLIGVAIFIALWAAVARGAAASGLNSLFAIAIAAIALRIFIIYLELFGSLAATGGGLVVGGLLLVALSWAWHRIVTARTARA
jgi:uncharacterized membrane protein